jgi:hypothetical protein
MRFEHIIEINDPDLPELPHLSPSQLWRGLLLRVRQPELFVPALECAAVTEVEAGRYQRQLSFGSFQVHDEVVIDDDLLICTRVVAPAEIAGMALWVQLQAPAPRSLVVRFIYDDDGSDQTAQLNAAEQRARQAAWLHADRDAVALIRRLADAGLLGD